MPAANLTDESIRVYKFGGTSLESGPAVMSAAERVAARQETPVVVVSAMSGVTDRLAALARDAASARGWEEEGSAALEELRERHRTAARHILGEGFPGSSLEERMEARFRELREALEEGSGGGADALGAGLLADRVAAGGEDLMVELMAAGLEARGLRAQVVDARTVIRTDARFGRAVPEDEDTIRLARSLLAPLAAQGTIPVVQGYVGATADGRTTTLGRGGSDFTAAIIGAALGAREVTIWTDVDGIYSADPDLAPGARILPELGYEEAVELAYFGARVIHPAAAKHAVARNVPLRIRNTFRPEAPGTLIRPDRRGTPGVAALAHKPRIALIRVRSRPLFMAYGFLARVFEALARSRVAVDLVATSHTSTAFTVDRDEELEAVIRDLEEFAEVELTEGLATVSAVGAGLLQAPGITGHLFRILDRTPIHLISQASDTALSFLVAEEEAGTIIRRLHTELLEDDPEREAP